MLLCKDRVGPKKGNHVLPRGGQSSAISVEGKGREVFFHYGKGGGGGLGIGKARKGGLGPIRFTD